MTLRAPFGHLKTCDGQILWADEDAHNLLGYAIGALVDMPFADICAVPSAGVGEAVPGGDMQVPALGATERSRIALRARNDHSVLVDMRGERMDDRCILWTLVPAATGLRAERLGLLERRDALTRLANRVPSFDDMPPRAHVEDAERLLAVCYLDIDRLRDINGEFGPIGGDAVLREVARRLRSALPHDAAVARVGGDEFALVVPVTSQPHCEMLLRQLLARIEHPIRLQDRLTRIRASIGVALMTHGEQPTEVMLQHAQQSVFFAKRAGSSQIHFFDAEQALEERQGVQARQRIADGLSQHEFRLAYQPKVDMRCGRVIGFEALIRWQHPERGLLQPASFIPLIEDHELVEYLGDWAIGEALRQLSSWQTCGVATVVSVNISPRHMQRPDFLERLGSHLAHWPQLASGVLELEILETSAIKDFAAAAQFIEACKALGVPVAMDDFGTGYSSLTCLRQLPVATLKLDQSFVHGVIDNVQDRAILKGILLLAEGLGRKAIAEGVESVAHGQALMALGCTLGQGYGIARPMPPADVPQWIVGFEENPLWQRAGDCN
ncbi:MAG TPA: bifunctional diguanylate cyclase/phosphodiesterase [Variovorax sp.]|nr:bifunctional diguanylate cyclase/phosphodiesterase [Variovorax sp.]